MRSGLLRKLSFTGSTAVGKILMVEAAEQVMRTSFELGGNGPAIVGHGADLEAAVPAIIRAKFVNNGQVCTTVNRLYVPAPRADAIADRLGSELDGIVVGWPDDEQTVVGPLISETSALTLTRSLEQAAAHGALVSQHGNPPPSGGNFVRPSLVRNVSTDDNLAQRELFGPVLTLISYEDLPTAIAEANATPYGLSAYVFSNDVTELDLCTARLRAGMIAINSPSPSSVSTPFGGIGWSGYGRENGVRGITEFMDETTLVH
jgi:succinate-semialdehyde dehydrogenase/glutarate-semialdehyde dehydrogenase